MKKKFAVMLVVILIISLLLSANATFAAEPEEQKWHIGLGYQLEDKKINVDDVYSFDGYDSSTELSSPIDAGKLIFGFNFTKNLSMDFSLYKSAESTVLQQFVRGKSGYEVGFGEVNCYESLQIGDGLSLPMILINQSLDVQSKTKYRTSGGSTEFVYELPSSWPKKDVVRFKGFLGYTESKGIIVSNFSVSNTIGNSAADIIIPVTYTDNNFIHTGTMKKPEGQVVDVQYFYALDNDGSTVIFRRERKGNGDWHDKWDKQKRNESDFTSDSDGIILTDYITIPINSVGSTPGADFSIRQNQESKGIYIGLSAIYDIVKNLDMELSARHIVHGSVENSVTGPGFYKSYKDEDPDITMAELAFTAHFVKGVDLKAAYSKTFASYELGGTKFKDEPGVFSVVIDYKF